jgi:hypothetical protein
MSDVRDVRLLLTERNALFVLVNRSGIGPTCLHFEEVDIKERTPPNVRFSALRDFRVSLLRYKDSDFFYQFGSIYDVFSPGPLSRVESHYLAEQGVPKNTIRAKWFQKWLARLQEEVTAPDLWAEMMATKSLATASALTPVEERFTERDRLYLAAELKRIEANVEQVHQLTSSQAEAIHDGFEEIKTEMNRYGKKDWVNLATGLLFNIMVGSALAPSAARDLYNMFVTAVAPLLDVAHRLIP